MPQRPSGNSRINRSVISGRANPAFIPARRLSPSGLAGCDSSLPWQATSPLFQSPLGAPFGPSDRLSWLSAFTAPTMPSADFSTVFSARFRRRPASIRRSTGEISRGKTRYLHRIDAGFTKCIPTADGGLRSHVPARPGCITPHIRFLFIVPQFRIGLPSDPASRRRPRLEAPTLGPLLLAFGSAKTWQSDLHRLSNAPCPAHTSRMTRRDAVEVYAAVSRHLREFASNQEA